MNAALNIVIILGPLLAIIVAIGFVISQKREERDEKEYINTLSESEKKEYLLQKNKDLQLQQSYYRMNDIVSNRKQ